MEDIVERLEKEIEQTEDFIKYYLSRGNPSIEIIEPNQFKKLDELELALKIIEKYGIA